MAANVRTTEAQRFVQTPFGGNPENLPRELLEEWVECLFFPELQLEIRNQKGGLAQIQQHRSSTLVSRHMIELNAPMSDEFRAQLEAERGAMAQADAAAIVETVRFPLDSILRIKQLVEARGLARDRAARSAVSQSIRTAIQAAHLFNP